MASTIDDRVVKLEFDNDSFLRRMGETIDSLEKLNETLELKGAAEGFAGVSSAADNVNLSGMAAGIDTIASKFNSMGAIGFAVLSRLTNSVLDFIKNTTGDILGPILTGGRKRAENLEQAKFAFEGLGINVEQAMADALVAVKGTAFGLDEAAQAASVFAGAGISLGADMQSALRGITGTAAITGRSFKEISDIFTSSAGTGVVNNQDLQQFGTRGLNAAAAVAKQLGITEQAVHEMASNGELDFKTFAKAMDGAFGEHATSANKTYSGSLANVRAAMSRLGASFFTDFLTQQRDLFNTLSPAIDNISEALQPLIKAFLSLSNIIHTRAIEIIGVSQFKNLDKFKFAVAIVADAVRFAFTGIALVVGRVKEAFRDIFPQSSFSTLINVAQKFKELTILLLPSKKTLEDLTRIFRGFFAILSIGWTVVKELAKFILDLNDSFVGLGRGNVLDKLGDLGDFFTNLQRKLVGGGGIVKFFDNLRESIDELVPVFNRVKDAVVEFLDNFDLGRFKESIGGVDVQVGRVTERFQLLKRILSTLSNIFAPIIAAFKILGGIILAAGKIIEDFFSGLAEKITENMNNQDYSHLFDALNTALFVGLAAVIANFLRGGGIAGLGDFVDTIKETFGALTGTLEAMQLKLKSEALMKIAQAIAVLTVSVLILSLIDSGALTKALTAMAIGFGQLMGSFAVFFKLASGPNAAKNFAVIATGMGILTTAILTLSIAMFILSKLDWEGVAKGLVAITGLLGIMTGAAILISKFGGSFILAAFSITSLSFALIILAGAVALFGQMDWETIGKGLLGIAGALLIIATVMGLMPLSLPLTAAGLILVGIALNLIAASVLIFGTMEWGDIGKGMAAIAGLLVVIGAAVSAMPPTLALQAAGLLLVAHSLVIIAGVMKIFGSMEWGEIAKGLTALGGTLIIIGAAVSAMSGAVVGAASLLVAAVAMSILADVIIRFASIKTGDLVRALIGIAAALTVIGLAAYLLLTTGATIAILALGYALVILGAGIALIGAGVYLLASGFEKLATSGMKGVKAFIAMLKEIAKSLPELAAQASSFVIRFLKDFLDDFPSVIKLLGVIVEQMLDTLIKLIPKLYEAGLLLISNILKAINDKAPDIIATGIFVITTFLQAVSDNIEQITELGVAIILKFVATLTANMPQLVASGALLLISFIQGLNQQVGSIVSAVTTLIVTFIFALAANYNRIIFAGVALIVSLLAGITQSIPLIGLAVGNLIIAFVEEIGRQGLRVLKAGIDMIGDFIEGLGANATNLIAAGVDAVLDFIQGLADAALYLASGAARVIRDFLKGLREATDKYAPEIREEGRLLAGSLINGFTGGLAAKVADNTLGRAIVSTFSPAVGVAFGLFGSSSPSKVFMGLGRSVTDGFIIGVKDGSDSVSNSMSVFNNAINEAIQGLSDGTDFNPTITPVLDLTKVQSEAEKIAGLIQNGSAISPTLSIEQAKLIASDTNQKQDTPAIEPGPREVKFEQNNYSPKALSAADIYRQTRNQITMAKEELSIP